MGEKIREGRDEHPCGRRQKAGEGGAVRSEDEANKPASGDPTEGAPDADGSELAARIWQNGEDDGGGEAPDGGAAELLELKEEEDGGGVPGVVDGPESESQEQTGAEAKVSEKARGTEVPVRHGADQHRRDECSNSRGGEGIWGQPLESAGLQHCAEGDEPQRNRVREEEKEGGEKDPLFADEIRAHGGEVRRCRERCVCGGDTWGGFGGLLSGEESAQKCTQRGEDEGQSGVDAVGEGRADCFEEGTEGGLKWLDEGVKRAEKNQGSETEEFLLGIRCGEMLPPSEDFDEQEDADAPGEEGDAGGELGQPGGELEERFAENASHAHPEDDAQPDDPDLACESQRGDDVSDTEGKVEQGDLENRSPGAGGFVSRGDSWRAASDKVGAHEVEEVECAEDLGPSEERDQGDGDHQASQAGEVCCPRAEAECEGAFGFGETCDAVGNLDEAVQ
ncbi:MAG: hypothetical protein RLZZ399_2446 [Verrucomicrobiota bacterium]